VNEYWGLLNQVSLDNKYREIYIRLCTKASDRACSKLKAQKNTGEFIETHHIVPQCFKPNKPHHRDNLVYLTLREHFIAHLLLTKMFVGSYKYKMMNAFALMASSKRFVCSNNRVYESLRKDFYTRLFKAGILGGARGHKGTPHTPEWKRLASESAKKQMSDPASRDIRRDKSIKQFSDPKYREISRKAARLQIHPAGRICVHEPSIRGFKRISPEELPSYAARGFVLGM